MKKLDLLFKLLTLLTFIAATGTSCQKGKDILGVSFGQLRISSVFSGNAAPLLVQVDGKVKDTLRVDKPNTNSAIILEAGKHKLVLINRTTKKALSTTTVTIAAAKTLSLPKFYYTGTAALFDDLTVKPTRDSMLVRIVTLDPALPDVMDLELSLYDYGSIYVPLATKKIKGVRKDRFSEFITLPNPAKLLPDVDASFILYAIEGYDSNNKNKKVMSIENGTNSYILLNNFQYFVPNAVVSMGIGPYNQGVQEPFTIFERIAK
ncbi:hypothetical protein SNE25_16185 [Mucilaginibacter sabulilitoris]|uniref:DUF4397 domain-containing protein n=1 Tax=Mucilaginibacter sabulilitoris TaxID=1173583 RepID=A0ABZ0TW09_9SPHI|nr:hypothetical protein [Mucilaginibacter sabulilitoris]WPU97062.1 hypothetical protein SNE25_16185 [Mucilaginibacter sabulilitoris]